MEGMVVDYIQVRTLFISLSLYMCTRTRLYIYMYLKISPHMTPRVTPCTDTRVRLHMVT